MDCELFKSKLSDLINGTFTNIFVINDEYQINLFNSNNSENKLTLRVSPISSPRNIYYNNNEYVTPPDSPRSDNLDMDDLCKYVKCFKDEFTKIIEELLRKHFEYIESSIDIKLHIDRITIRFKIHLNNPRSS